jgi:hypothetical protein
VSKVVHLSNDAHALAKVYCKSRGLKMSDWVGSLIIDAISVQEEPKPQEQPQDVSLPRKKQLPRVDETVQTTDDGVPVYAQPPFWAKSVPIESELEEPPLAGFEPVAGLVSEPVSGLVSEPVSETVSEPVSEPASEPVSEPASEPISQFEK